MPRDVEWLIVKYLVTAGVVVLVSEAAVRSEKLGGLLAALPLVTVLTLIWLHVEGQAEERIGRHAWYTLWYVLPTLPMFAYFPLVLPKLGFWPTLISACGLTCACFALAAVVLRRFGIELWP